MFSDRVNWRATEKSPTQAVINIELHSESIRHKYGFAVSCNRSSTNVMYLLTKTGDIIL